MSALRPPSEVMRLSRLGASHANRLSFMRVLLRGLRRGDWTVDRPVWEIDAQGVGRAVYRARGDGHCVSLVAFAHDLPAEKRSDRVIAEAWDATFALMLGEPDAADLDRLAANVPLQEAGRISDTEAVLSRANRSVRLWDHVVDALSEGRQPDPAQVEAVGYLMRTTAVYGSGKFGAADHGLVQQVPLLNGPFRAEMLAVWLIRAFCLDLVEHMARAKGGAQAVVLNPALRRRFGIGNSTGLGMAPFLVNHPALLNAWITARETALARVRGLAQATPDTRRVFVESLDRARALVATWSTDHAPQAARIADLVRDLDRVQTRVADNTLTAAQPWDDLWIWAQDALGLEAQELLVSLMLEPHGALIDDLADQMGCEEAGASRIDGSMTVGTLRALIAQSYDWAFKLDPDDKHDTARFWYVSEAKLEPRLGQRHSEPGHELELPLDVARAVLALDRALADWPEDATVASFLRALPDHRGAVRRVQLCARAPFAEIRDNLIAEDVMPIDMLRCKLSFFGATRFDPRSDRWVRITMFQGAPFPDELADARDDDWVLPPVGAVA